MIKTHRDELEGLLDKPGAFSLWGETPQQLTEAAEILELMIGEPIIRRYRSEVLTLDLEPVLLAEYPVANTRVEGERIDGVEKYGVIYPDLPNAEYTVTYEVGYKPERIPEIIRQAVLHIWAFEREGSERYRELVQSEIEILRLNRTKTREVRNDGTFT